MSDNPISEASSNSLEEYFSRDPNDLSDKDIDIICAELERQRMKWENGIAMAKKPRATKSTTLTFSLDELLNTKSQE